MIKLRQIRKLNGQRRILDDVNLTIHDGDIVGMIDQDGQAILELAQMLSGRSAPEYGQVFVDGERMTWRFRSYRQDVGVIYREPYLIESLNIANHIFLGHETQQVSPIFRWLNLFDEYQIISKAKALLSELNFALPPVQTHIYDLSIEQKQLVAFAQLVVKSPKLIVLDHPGRTLSLPYQEQLFERVRVWRDENKITILGTSNLDMLFDVCDRVIVLRDGKIVIDSPIDDTSREAVLAALISERKPEQVTPVIWALDSYYKAFQQAQRLRYQQQLLEQDLAQQNSIRQELLEQLSVQVSALDEANVALQDAQRRLLTEREDERKHLARELHDQIIQDLLTFNYQLESLGEEHPELDTAIHQMRDSVRHMVDDLRGICGRLRPPTIDSLGLGVTLQSYTRTWSERTGIDVTLQVDDKIGRLTEEIELSLFRIVQESLNNAAKHANASAVSVYLTYVNSRMLQLLIMDNGVGIAEAFDLAQLSTAGHFGILGISERVALLGGRIEFRNLITGGLQIQVEVPHPTSSKVTY